MGGMLPAIERGWVQREIAESAYRYQKEVEAAERLVVGVNAFAEASPARMQVLRVPPELERKQIARVRRFRGARENPAARRALARLREAAAGEENLFRSVLQAVTAGATLGEISDAMREVFGTHAPRNDV